MHLSPPGVFPLVINYPFRIGDLLNLKPPRKTTDSGSGIELDSWVNTSRDSSVHVENYYLSIGVALLRNKN